MDAKPVDPEIVRAVSAALRPDAPMTPNVVAVKIAADLERLQGRCPFGWDVSWRIVESDRYWYEVEWSATRTRGTWAAVVSRDPWDLGMYVKVVEREASDLENS